MTAKHWIAAGLLAASGLAHADVTLAGVKYEESSDLRGTRLQLNGAGIRYKGPFKVYAAGLYVTRKSNTPEEVIATARPQARRRDHAARHRCLGTGQAVRPRGGRQHGQGRRVQAHSGPDAHEPDLQRPQEPEDRRQLRDRLGARVGTIVTVRGVPQGEPFREPEFFNALLRIWLGPAPADWRLKESLLGKQA
jgi:hypothetical protein